MEPSHASTTTTHSAAKILELAQVSSPTPEKQSFLSFGSRGPDVQLLQTQLQQLGYYDSLVDGQYGPSTQTAVAKFQKAKSLNRTDGIADLTTRDSLQAAVTAKNSLVSTPNPTPKPTAKPSKRGFIWWTLLGVGVLVSIGTVFYLKNRVAQNQQLLNDTIPEPENADETNQDADVPQLAELNHQFTPPENTDTVTSQQTVVTPPPTKFLPAETTSRLVKVNIVDELIKDLRSPDPIKRSKAIWSLGEHGDSRAIQPLVDLIIDVDSQQHGLILAALAEISIRTLKPMNRALAVSMQNESSQVRQNAIRDLARLYDMMGQMTHILRHAAEDTDPEVQATAQYALSRMNRLRMFSEQENLAENGNHEASQ
jgi:peptidoglycan hydrolase-like protein with peptidoglycan-binding domain